jgi:hypothetical protein
MEAFGERASRLFGMLPGRARTDAAWMGFSRRLVSVAIASVIGLLGGTSLLTALALRQAPSLLEAFKKSDPLLWLAILGSVVMIVAIITVGVIVHRIVASTERVALATSSYGYRLDRQGQMLDYLDSTAGDPQWRKGVTEKIVDNWDAGPINHLDATEEGRGGRASETQPSESEAPVSPRRRVQRKPANPPDEPKGEVGDTGL